MKKRIRTLHLFAIPVAMFGFGYLMVPIYDVFCDITGLNGKTGTISTAVELFDMISVEFQPEVSSMMVHPGKTYETRYVATNRLDRSRAGQAVPSVAPSRAATHFNKTECFCFEQQHFEARERKEMPLIFVVDPALPRDIDTVTLSYTFFELDTGIN